LEVPVDLEALQKRALWEENAELKIADPHRLAAVVCATGLFDVI
jgi:hypothetical protein